MARAPVPMKPMVIRSLAAGRATCAVAANAAPLRRKLRREKFILGAPVYVRLSRGMIVATRRGGDAVLWRAADPPDDEEDAGSRFAPEPWRGWSGLMAHPASRCGGGGPGVFRHASPLGSQVRLAYGLPHPQSP